MFILFAFIALSAAADPQVQYNKANYLITPEGKAIRKVIILNKCVVTSDGKSAVKYEPISDEKYKYIKFKEGDTKCEQPKLNEDEKQLNDQDEPYVYAETIPEHIGYGIVSIEDTNCGALSQDSFLIFVDTCGKTTAVDQEDSNSEKISKNGNNLVRTFFQDPNCQTKLQSNGADVTKVIGECDKCGAAMTSFPTDKMSLKCEKYSPSSTPSGGSTTKVDYKTAKFAVDKGKRVDRSVVELRKCSKSTDNKYMKAEGTSETQYKTCTYTDDKCTAGESCGNPEDGEFFNELPKHIGYSVVSTDAQCTTLTDASFTIYVEGCIETKIIQGGDYEKAVIEGGKLKIKSYTDDKCTKENPENLLKERDVQECGKCNGESQRSAMKCHAYGSNGSIQTFVLFALTILLFLF